MVSVFESGSRAPSDELNLTVSQYTLQFLKRLNDVPNAKVIAAGLVSAVVGVVLYSGVIALVRVIGDIRQEIAVDKSITNSSFSSVLIARLSSKILAAIGFIWLLVISFWFLIPYWMSLMSLFVYNGLQLSFIHYLLFGLIGLSINIYAIWVIAHLTWVYEESV